MNKLSLSFSASLIAAALWTVSPACAGSSLPPAIVGTTVGTFAPGCSIATSGITCRSPADRADERINIRDYGARMDVVGYGDAAITGGTTAFHSAAASFSQTDVGKVIVINSAGAANTSGSINQNPAYLSFTSTIASVQGTHDVTLTDAPPTTVSASLWEYFTNDIHALNIAIGVMNNRNIAGYSSCLYIPAGWTGIRATTGDPSVTPIGSPGCVMGDGVTASNIQLAADYPGDLFAWSEAWTMANYQPNPFILPKSQKAGARIHNLAIWGNRGSTVQQNAIVFYDRAVYVRVSDIFVGFMNGRAFYTGVTKNTSQGWMAESHIDHFRTWRSGNASVPVVEFSSVGGTGNQATNEIWSADMNLVGNEGRGLVIRNNSTAVSDLFFFTQFRAEELLTNPSSNGDAITVGDPTMTGVVSDIVFTDANVQDVQAGTNAITLTAPTSSPGSIPFGVQYNGIIGGGPGNALNIQAGRNLRFRLTDVAVSGTDVVIGPSTLVSPQSIIIESGGSEASLTYSINSTSSRAARSPVFITGLGGNNPSLSIFPQDNTAVDGGNRGANAVDLCFRSSNAFVASGAGAFCVGHNNWADGNDSATIGESNTAHGNSSFIHGLYGFDRSRPAVDCLSNAASQGANQGCSGVLRTTTTGTTPSVITSDGAAPNTAGVPNIYNLPAAGGAYGFAPYIVVAFDPTNTKACDWLVSKLLVVKGSTNSTTRIVGTPTVAQDQCDGTLTGATLTVAADTTNGGITHTVTGVAGVMLDVTAYPSAAETQ